MGRIFYFRLRVKVELAKLPLRWPEWWILMMCRFEQAFSLPRCSSFIFTHFGHCESHVSGYPMSMCSLSPSTTPAILVTSSWIDWLFIQVFSSSSSLLFLFLQSNQIWLWPSVVSLHALFTQKHASPVSQASSQWRNWFADEMAK